MHQLLGDKDSVVVIGWILPVILLAMNFTGIKPELHTMLAVVQAGQPLSASHLMGNDSMRSTMLDVCTSSTVPSDPSWQCDMP